MNTTTQQDELEDRVFPLVFGIGIDSFNRFPEFIKNTEGLTDNEYWYGLGLAYTGSDNLCEYRKESKEAFSSLRGDREYLMTEDELREFNELPETVTIYRGMTVTEAQSKDYAISWSLDKKIAGYFAETYPRNFKTNGEEKIVVELTVPKTSLIALFNGRDEKEVIYTHSQ